MVAIQKQNEFYIQNEVINMKGLKTNSVRDSKANKKPSFLSRLK